MLNNHNEIVFPGFGQDKANKNQGWEGIFLRGVDGKLQPIVLTGDKMPDGRKLDGGVYRPSVNHAGVITSLGAAANDPENGAYRWDRGTFMHAAVLGMDAPEGGKIRDVRVALLNNKNDRILVLASLSAEGPLGLYRFAAGKLTALVVPGQTLPDGSRFSSIPLWRYGVSTANELGQHAFLARLADGSTSAYRPDPDGKLTTTLKSGATTELGKITLIGSATRPAPGLFHAGARIGLNSQGQVAFDASIDGGPTALVLLTPTAP